MKYCAWMRQADRLHPIPLTLWAGRRPCHPGSWNMPGTGCSSWARAFLSPWKWGTASSQAPPWSRGRGLLYPAAAAGSCCWPMPRGTPTHWSSTPRRSWSSSPPPILTFPSSPSAAAWMGKYFWTAAAHCTATALTPGSSASSSPGAVLAYSGAAWRRRGRVWCVLDGSPPTGPALPCSWYPGRPEPPAR